MAALEAFIPTDMLLDLSAARARTERAALIFQRFQIPNLAAALTVVEPTSGLGAAYNDGGYQLFYLSSKPVPAHPEDFAFLDREAAHLIEFAGGRQRARDLEQVTIRLLAQRSKATPTFTALESAMRELCRQGALLNGRPCPRIFYAASLVSQPCTWWVDLETKTIRAEPSPESR